MSLATAILDRIFKHRVIVNCDRDAYLYRWYVFRTPWVALFIHKFVRSDEDRALHDHPWPFLVIPIWRGYIEHSEVRIRHVKLCPKINPEGTEENKEEWDWWEHWWETKAIRRWVYPIIGTRFRRSTYRHRVELFLNEDGDDLPAWSLFFRFKECRVWGFWPKEGFIAWDKWWSTKC